MKMAVFLLFRSVIWQKFTDVSEVLAASIRVIALMMEVVSIYKTSVNFCQITRRNPEDSHLHPLMTVYSL
jgi:hypothetical protein